MRTHEDYLGATFKIKESGITFQVSSFDPIKNSARCILDTIPKQAQTVSMDTLIAALNGGGVEIQGPRLKTVPALKRRLKKVLGG